MSVLLLPPIFQFFDNNGDPLANGFVYTYAAGTTTPLATYTDSTGTSEAPNPIQLNSAGRPTSGSGAIWGQGAYKFIVKDANGVQVGDTLDNVTSFTGLASASNAYAETFSGDGVQTVFTTSSDLGTDPKAILVSVANGLQEICQNGSFATDTIWVKGAGWTIGAGVATATGAISTAISQTPVLTIVPGQAYAVTYTITRSAGGLIPSIGGQNGTERTASGTYREVIIAAATTPIAFTGNGFTGTLDNVSITEAISENMALLPSNAYTISGTTLTFASAPPTGTNNIDVRAPSLLVGAASSAAALAQGYAAAALTSETNAAASAALASANIKTKPAVACATTADITLSGEQTIDGVLTSGSRVLVKDQSLATQNGVYVSAAGAWTRATDADTWTEIQGQSVFTSGGSTNINKTWANTNEAGGTIGVDNITWTQLTTAPSVNSVSTSAIQDGAVTTAKLAPLTSINGGQLAGLRNKLINGDMRRSDYAVQYNLTTTAGYGALNRWWATQATSAASSIARNNATTPPTGFLYHMRVGRNSGSGTTGAITIGQIIETANCIPLQGKTLTLSFYAKAGANFSADSSNLSIAVTTGTGTDQGLASYIAGTWTGYTGVYSGTQAITTTHTRYSVTFTVGSSISEIAVQFSYVPVGTAGADDNFFITGVQLEVGSVATPFEDIGEGLTQLLCARYLPVQSSTGTQDVIGSCYANTTTSAAVIVQFLTQARVAPSGVIVSGAGHVTVQLTNTAFAGSASAWAGSSLHAGRLGVTVSGATAGTPGHGYFNTASGKLLWTGCEL